MVVSTGGRVRITSPDLDGSPYTESFVIGDPRGAAIVLAPAAGEAGPDRILVDGGGGLSRIDVD